MSLAAKVRRTPLRAVTGAYIVNSGVGKFSAGEDTAKALHGLATGTYPFLGKVQPKVFAKGLAAGEVAVGSVLLLPFISPVVAGAVLTGFSGALLKLYWNTEGMHEPNDPRPTQQGVAVSKDVWMFGIGSALIADGLLEPAHDKRLEVSAAIHEKRAEKGRSAKRQAKKATKKSNGELLKQARKAAKDAQAEARKRGQKAAKQAAKASAKAGGQLAAARAEQGPVVVERAKQAREAAKNYVDEYGPVAAEKAKQAREAAKNYVDEYGPVAAEKAKQARDAAKSYVDEYGPVAVEKAKQAGDVAKGYVDEYGPVAVEKAKQAREVAKGYVDEYAPVAAEKGKQARKAAKQAAERAKAAAGR